MTAAALMATGQLSLVVAILGVLVVAGGAGLLASLVLLRYADTLWAGWLLGVRTTHDGGENEESATSEAAVTTLTDRATAGASPSTEAKTESTANDPEPLDHLAADFAVHAQAVRAQVSRYADLLADGDAVLRARLRRLEDGGLSSSRGHTSGGAR